MPDRKRTIVSCRSIETEVERCVSSTSQDWLMAYAGHTDFGDTLMQYSFVARCQSPGEIKRREVNWTLTKKLA